MEESDNPSNGVKPTTHQRDLAKLPKCLAPLIERQQWAVWRWTQRPGGWQKPPFQSAQPDRHASTSDPSTWSSYAAALSTVQAGHADGITYVLTADDPFAAIDLDHCRDPDTHSIDIWAQLFLMRGRDTYQEVTPSGTGCRIWGLATGEKLHRKFDLVIDDKPIAAELFRRTNKALTITGYQLDSIRELTSIDRVMDWAVVWGERRKAAAAPAPASGNGFDSSGNGCGYSVDQIEEIVRTGAPAGGNRSDLFHMIVGHYVGVGWSAEQILAHVEQHPHGIGERYLRENRLAGEIDRSCKKYGAATLPSSDDGKGWTNGGLKTKAPQPEAPEPDDPELQDDSDLDEEPANPQDDPELRDEAPQKSSEEKPRPADDADLEDDDLGDDLDDELDDEPKEVGMAANDLCAAVFEPPNYVVPGYVVEGLTLFAGKPKVGKSWLMLHVALAVARGGFTLGDTDCAIGDVLYAALEDNKRRLQRRLLKLLDGQSSPKRLRILSAGEMPLLSQGGTDLIRTWIEQVPEPKLVVVDVLAKVRHPRRKDQGLYDSDYAAVQGLKTIADEYGIAVVVIHHLRKMDADDPLDQVSGTTGLAGSADTVLVLNRTSSGTTLLGRGRDVEDIDRAVLFDPGTCTWTVLGDAGRVRYTGERVAVLAALREAGGPMSLADIAAASGMKANNARQLLLKLVRDGVVRRGDHGKYSLTPNAGE